MSTTAPAKAGRKEWIGLAVIALPCLLYSMDLTVLNLAIPNLSADLKPSSSELLWIVDIYGFMVAGMLITMGTLGDHIGRRKLLLIGAVVFGAASVAAAFSTSPGMLIAARAMLGIAGATLAPSTLSLIRNMFLDDKQRTFAISIWMTSYSIGGAIGPLLGGILLEHFSWGSVFLISVPVMVLLLITGPLLLPEYRDPGAGKLDLLSALQSIVAILAIIFGFKKIAENGLDWLPVLCIIAGAITAFVFVRRQGKLQYPLIDLRLFRIPTFKITLLTFMMGAFISFGSYIFIGQYLQLVLNLSPFQSGLWTLPWAVGVIIGSLLTSQLAKRVHPVRVIYGGFALASIGFFLVSQVNTIGPAVAILGGSFLFSISLAPVFTLTIDYIIGSAPPEKAGAASAVSETSAELGGALGIALLGSLGTAVYRNFMVKNITADVPEGSVEAAKDTLGGAVAEASKLPSAAADILLQSAREAFTDTMQLAVIVCASLSAALALLIRLKLKPGQVGASANQTLQTTEQAVN
ncbi:MAG: MFS transporter [Chitinophagaceae bacterium]|nr:MFS transporter [Chitinophagaceae bacterium]